MDINKSTGFATLVAEALGESALQVEARGSMVSIEMFLPGSMEQVLEHQDRITRQLQDLVPDGRIYPPTQRRGMNRCDFLVSWPVAA